MDLSLNKEDKVMDKKIINKLTSRKFIVTAITAIAGLITLVVGENETVDTCLNIAVDGELRGQLSAGGKVGGVNVQI